MTRRVFRRRRWRSVVALMVAAVVLALVAVLAWWNPLGWRPPRPGWAGTEQAGWIAGIAAAALALASFIGDRVDARRDTGARERRVAGTVRVGRVPQRAGWWQDRHTDIDLAKAARAGPTAVLTQVLSGLGGVGKTQLAAQFARGLDAAGELDVLVWITAANRDAIVDRYAETAYVLQVCDPQVEPSAAAGLLLGWLEHTDRRWLIVLDNLDAPAEVSGLWPPDNRDGRTVVTTRSRDPILGTDSRTLVPVDVFTPAEAARYLTRATGSLADMDALAADLAYLPLAVAQAAAFIRDRGIDAATYRQLLNDRRRTLDQLTPPTMPDDYRSTVAATWLLSVESANAQPPRGLARSLLDIASLLDPNGIPTAVFTTYAVTDYLAAAAGGEVTVEDALDGLRNLHRLNLITHDPAAETVRVHALVQRTARDACTNSQQRVLAATCANALLELWPELERDADHAQALRTNANALHTNVGTHLYTADDGMHPVLSTAARSLGIVGLVTPAITAYQQLLDDVLQALGPDHPDTLTTRSHLAHWRGEAGGAAGAATAYEQLLADHVRIFGPDHPDTLTTRQNLASRRGDAGDPTGAATALEQLLTDRLRVFGPDHPYTLNTRYFLAHWRGEAGDAAGAATAYEQLFADHVRIFGPDHPDTLITRNNLASWRGKAGDAAGAATAYEQLLADHVRIFGPDHPYTLTTRNNLANWRGKAGDAAGAAAAYEQLLAHHLQILGPDHPSILAIRHNLANWRGKAGDAAGAATALEQLLPHVLRVLGSDHPHALATRQNLANWRRQTGNGDHS